MASNQVSIAPVPFVKWDFTASTTAQKNEKIERARSFLEFYLKGHEEGLRKNKPTVNLRFRVVDGVKPRRGKGRFTYTPTVKRKPVAVGGPESGVDPAKPSPPPPL